VKGCTQVPTKCLNFIRHTCSHISRLLTWSSIRCIWLKTAIPTKLWPDPLYCFELDSGFNTALADWFLPGTAKIIQSCASTNCLQYLTDCNWTRRFRLRGFESVYKSWHCGPAKRTCRVVLLSTSTRPTSLRHTCSSEVPLPTWGKTGYRLSFKHI
jgi:hypothetical protein